MQLKALKLVKEIQLYQNSYNATVESKDTIIQRITILANNNIK
jgi:hypothetical protein